MNKKFVAVILVFLMGIGMFLTIYSITAITANSSCEPADGLPTIVIDAGHPESDKTKNDYGANCKSC